MRVLMIHNYYQQPGGEDASFKIEADMLEKNGHTVIRYTKHNDEIKKKNLLSVAISTIWNNKIYNELRSIIRTGRIDIVHCQNIFPLISPAAYYAAKAEGVPVVQTLRNYRLFCPGALFFRDGLVCEDCLKRILPWPGVLHSCYRQNRAATGVVAAMLVVHRLMRTWARKVDVFIALTEFSRSKFIQGGLAADKIVVKPNFVDSDGSWVMGKGKKGDELGERYALFVGRLSQEKGLETLLAAWKHLYMPLKIVGDGPLMESLAAKCEGLPHIHLLGRKSGKEVLEYMEGASFLVFPSEWYETFGRVAIEAFAKGTPVIASRIGTIAELVDHGRTGLHFRSGDPEDLAMQVKWIIDHPTELERMRQEARAEYEVKYTAERNCEMLMEIYERAIARTH